MKISKNGVITGIERAMKFTAIYMVLMFIFVAVFDAPITLKDMFVDNIFFHIFVVLELFLGYKKGKAIELAEGEVNDKKRTGTNN